jgi:hypothetical protein
MTFRKLGAGERRELAKPYDFHEQLKIGEAFETQVKEALSEAGLFYRSASMAEQRRGIDIISAYKNIECKFDSYARNNGKLFIELTQGDALGCIFSTTADIILFSTGVKVYCFEPIELRLWFAKHSQNLTLKRVSTGSTGVLFPVTSAETFCELSDLSANILGWLTL